MIKKFMQSIAIVLAALFAFEAFAQESTTSRERDIQQAQAALEALVGGQEASRFSAAVFGEVRVEWRSVTQSAKDGDGEDIKVGLDNGSNVLLQDGDTYFDLVLTFEEPEDGSVGFGKLRWFADGTQRITVSGTTTFEGPTGTWAAKGFAEWNANAGQAFGGDNKYSKRDHFVHFARNSLDKTQSPIGVVLGRTTYLDVYRKGQKYIYLEGLSRGTNFDNRSEQVEVHFNIFEGAYLAFNLELARDLDNVLGGTDINGDFPGAFSTDRAVSVIVPNAEDGTVVSRTVSFTRPTDHTNLAGRFNWSNELIDVGALFFTASAALAKDRVAASTRSTTADPTLADAPDSIDVLPVQDFDDGYTSTASGIAIGVSLNFGFLKPYLNLVSASGKTEHDALVLTGPAADAVAGSPAADNYTLDLATDAETVSIDKSTSVTELGLSLEFGDNQGLLVRIGNGVQKPNEDSTLNQNSFEIGYQTNIAGVNFQAGYLSDTDTRTIARVDEADAEPETITSTLGFRFDYAF